MEREGSQYILFIGLTEDRCWCCCWSLAFYPVSNGGDDAALHKDIFDINNLAVKWLMTLCPVFFHSPWVGKVSWLHSAWLRRCHFYKKLSKDRTVRPTSGAVVPATAGLSSSTFGSHDTGGQTENSNCIPLRSSRCRVAVHFASLKWDSYWNRDIIVNNYTCGFPLIICHDVPVMSKCLPWKRSVDAVVAASLSHVLLVLAIF